MSDIETRNLADLHGNPQNPRTMNEHDAKALARSIKEFGDLSGIVFNVQTGQLVGGHMRTETFKQLEGDKQVVVTQRFAQPNAVGTVAVGYVTYNGEFYAYREVDWDLPKETAANIAANRIQGDWDEQLLAEANAMLKAEDPSLLAATGQTSEELLRLAGETGPDEKAKDDDGLHTLHVTLTEHQLAVVYDAIARMKAERQLGSVENKDLDGNALYYICQHYIGVE